MTDHTPEPWLPDNMPTGVEARQTDYWIVLGADDWLRARACVNACAGIPTEQLGDVKALVTAATTTARGLLATSRVEAKAGNDVIAADYEDYAMRLNAALAPFRKD